MRILTTILALYLLALSILPCTDSLPHIDSANSIENNITDDQHNHSHDTEDHCTPFCICACCGSFVVVPNVYQLDRHKVDLSSTYQSIYTFDYSFDYNEGVWHPPTNC